MKRMLRFHGKGFASIPADVRFWNTVKIDEPDNCWLWDGAKDGRFGYGHFYITATKGNRKHIPAHRYAYEWANGIKPNGQVLHSCDVPACVNPYHLRDGTHQENMDDRNARKRTAKGERSGPAILKWEQVREIKTLRGVETSAALGKRFGVCRSTISHIWTGRLWRADND